MATGLSDHAFFDPCDRAVGEEGSVVGRYYDPATGQFLTVDPDVVETGEPFDYAGDDPVNDADPRGLSKYPPGWWVKGSKVVEPGTEGARLLPSEGERHYIPPKGSRGEPKFANNETGRGFEDSEGVVWKAARGNIVGDFHWDATNPGSGGENTNVAQNGDVLHGGDNFPNNVSLGHPFDPSAPSSAGGGSEGDGGGFDDPAGMIGMAFPTCGPGGLVTAFGTPQANPCNNWGGMGPPNADGAWNG